MADDRLVPLMHGYAIGALSEPEERELAEAIAHDSNAARSLFEQVVVHRLLQQHKRAPVSADRVLAALSDLPAVTKGVMARVQKSRIESARIERPRRASRPRRSSAPVAWAIAAGLLVMCVIAGETMRRQHGGPSVIGTLTSFEPGGPVLVRRGGSDIPLAGTCQLLASDRITSGSSAPVAVAFNDGTRLELGPGTVLTMQPPGEAKALTLARGVVHATVTPQPSGHPLTITASDVRATVVGTEFTFEALATSDPRLVVEHGRVRLDRLSDHASIDVGAGQSVIVRPGHPLALAGKVTSHAAVSDAHGLKKDPSSRHGTEAALRVADEVEPHGVCIACVRFALDEQPVARAVLRLTVVQGSGRCEVYRSSDDSWSEASVNYYHLPDHDPAPIGSFTADREGVVEIELDAGAVGTGGIVLVLVPTDGCNLAIASHECGSSGPQLEVTVEP
ncbi:MAG: FecR domain-containing protein [Planctomycetes bacterium]|nr:FecR domain-containing protein [Planctomycetota bacterium]